MDSLYSGLRALEWQSESKKGLNKSVENEEMPAPIIHIVDDMFILARDAMVLLEITALEPLPPKDEKGAQNQCQNLNQNRTKEGNSSEEFSKDSVERDEKRLTELGRHTLEIFVLTHIFSSKIEVAYQEVVALKRQEELIREEEAAGHAEHELKAKRIAAEKEKRAKKKQGKQKRNNRKGKDRSLSSKPNHVPTDSVLQSSYHEKTFEDFEAKSEDTASEKIETLDVSDVSDTGAEVTEIAEHADSGIWDTDVSEVLSVVPASNSEMQNDRSENKFRSTVDDSSSTCSTESVPSVVIHLPSRGILSQENKEVTFSSRGRNRRKKVAHNQTSNSIQNSVNRVSDAVPDSGHVEDATNHSRTDTPERVVFPLNDQKEHGAVLQNKQNAEDVLDQSTRQLNKADLLHLPSSKNGFTSSQRPGQVSKNDSVEPIPGVESSSGVLCPAENSSHATVRLYQSLHVDKLEKQKLLNVGKVAAASGTSCPLSRPSSAPLVPDQKPTVSPITSAPASPFLSRSVSAFGQLGVPEAPSPMQNYAPLSYRNATIGKSAAWSDCLSYEPGPSSSSKGILYSQPDSVATVSSPASSPAWSDQIPVKPVSSFTTVSAKASVSGGCAPAGPNILGTSNFVNDARWHTDLMSGSEEPAPGLSDRQVHGSATDEFPHLDIINYLLEEDSMDSKLSAKGHTCFRPSWPYVRGSLPRADSGSSNASRRFYGSDQYYGDMSNGLSESIQGLDEGRDLLSRESESPAYPNSEMDGWMFNQWPLGTPGSSVLSGSGTRPECSPLSYQLLDYSNLPCSVNGYIMYPHANGF